MIEETVLDSVTVAAAADWSRILTFAITMIQIALTVALLYLGSKFVGKKDCEEKCKEHKDKREALEKRVTVTELSIQTVPTGKEMKAINKRLGDMEGDIKALRTASEAQADTMERIERPVTLLLEHHLGRDK